MSDAARGVNVVSWGGPISRPKTRSAYRPLRAIAAALACLLPAAGCAGAADAGSLKLLISIEQPSITAPFAARLTLNLHNAGKEPLWLYHRPRAPRPEVTHVQEEYGPSATSGGSTLAIKLEPAEASQPVGTPAQGMVLESVGLPRPRLVRVGPGEDYEEKVPLRLQPARDAAQNPVWGSYRLMVTYRAEFSNGEEIRRNLGLLIWQGETASNTIGIELQPSPSTAQGSVTGSVLTPDSRPISDARVSLSDAEERLLDQALTDAEGRFSFTHLPFGLYWVTARREDASGDTAVFEHVQLTVGGPAGTPQLVMTPPEIYESKKLLHKPVIFLVTDHVGRPLEKAGLEVTWSNGPVLENQKGETGEGGTLVLELLPGRNFVTLKRRGCPNQDERADVPAGGGVEGFKLVEECEKR